MAEQSMSGPIAPVDINSLSLPDLWARFMQTGLPTRLFELARDEDLGSSAQASERWGVRSLRGSGDVTTDVCIDPSLAADAAVVLRRGGIVGGLEAAPELLRLFSPACEIINLHFDGERVKDDTVVARVRGPMDEVLGLERTLLNVLGRLSGIATRTARFVAALPTDTRAKIYDTRKTTPGLRVLEKYAVRCGGGMCHRLGLYDAVLMKDNHLANVSNSGLAEFVLAAAKRARAKGSVQFVQVEVDTLEQLRALLTLSPGVMDIVLLDNMGPSLLREAVAVRDEWLGQHGSSAKLELEASGGVTLEAVGEVAATGVDRISIGGLTHAAISLDVGLDITEVGRRS